ncbi:MAG: formate dehydrogenase accessory sulfurtransferase FdhD [Lapillicoccus sp.]
MGRVTQRARAVRVEVSDHSAPRLVERPDTVVVEAPMEIRVDGVPLTVTMRTPGDDFDLTIGFLLSEGLIASAEDVRQLMHCQDEDESGSPTYNVVDVNLADGVTGPNQSEARRFLTTSACGVCGTASIDAVRTTGRYALESDEMRIDPAVLAGLPGRLRRHQKVFDRTGGVHAAGLFTPDGDVVVVREDIGRHNAVDKVVGWAAREGRLPLTGHVLVVSSRASFELTQKAFVAGIPVLAAVSAPSSLAVDLATEVGLTLVGFVRAPRLTVYTGRHRLGLPEAGGRDEAADPAVDGHGDVADPIPDGGRETPHLGRSVSTTGQ